MSYKLFYKVWSRKMKKKIQVYLDYPFNENIDVRVYGEVKGNGMNFYIVEGISNRGELWTETYGETTYMVYDIDKDELRPVIFTDYIGAYDYCIELQANNNQEYTSRFKLK